MSTRKYFEMFSICCVLSLVYTTKFSCEAHKFQPTATNCLNPSVESARKHRGWWGVPPPAPLSRAPMYFTIELNSSTFKIKIWIKTLQTLFQLIQNLFQVQNLWSCRSVLEAENFETSLVYCYWSLSLFTNIVLEEFRIYNTKNLKSTSALIKGPDFTVLLLWVGFYNVHTCLLTAQSTHDVHVHGRLQVWFFVTNC